MKSFLRFLQRNPLYTLINVTGLAISLMFVILLSDYTWRQFSIDSSRKHADRIVVLGSNSNLYGWRNATRELAQMLPEVENTCCVLAHGGTIKAGDKSVGMENSIQGLHMPNILLADSSFFTFFDYEILKGNSQSPLAGPSQCVITESLAHSLFPDGDAVGKAVRIVGEHNLIIGNDNPYDSTLVYTVSAVMRNLDKTILPNSTQIVVNYKRQPQVCGFTASNDIYAYSGFGYTRAFLLLRPNADLNAKRDLIKRFINTNVGATKMSPWQEATLTPLRQLMFSPLNNGMGLHHGDRGRLTILLSVVIAILFFAVTNYINLTVANTGFRSKEMAMRMLLGSSRRSISLQLIVESALMVFVSFGIGLLLAFAFQSNMATLFRGKIELANDVNVGSVGLSLLFIAALGVISGIIPSLQMGRYKPVDVVKGSFRYHSKMTLSRVFIVLQSLITVVMLSAALVIYLQVRHLVNAPLGFNFENVFMVCAENVQAMRSELAAMPFVKQVGTFQGTCLSGNYTSASTISVEKNGVKEDVNFYLLSMDSTTLDIYGLKLLHNYGLAEGAYYTNEEGERKLGLARGERDFEFNDGRHLLSGVFKDFRMGSIMQYPYPFIIQLEKTSDIQSALFLVKTDGSAEAKQRLREAVVRVDKTTKNLEWMVTSLKEDVVRNFEDQANTLHIVGLFAFVALLISTLGYVGTSVFFIRQHRKEVGIRKIMGCSTEKVTVHLLRRFCMPLAASWLIAVPLAWYIMSLWLQDFAYRISLEPWMFLLVIFVSLLQAVLSVLLQTLKAACTNPVKTIRIE